MLLPSDPRTYQFEWINFSVFKTSNVTFSEELIAYWLSFVHTFKHILVHTKCNERAQHAEAPGGEDMSLVRLSRVEDGKDEAERCGVVASLVDQAQVWGRGM